MKKNFINTTHIEGILYEHDLKKKESGPKSKNPGTEFINGTIDIATDKNKTNIVQIHFSYVTRLTSKGKKNSTFDVLNDIIEGKVKTLMKDGEDKAAKVRVDSAIGLNEFYPTQNGEISKELYSGKRNEGGFIHLTSDLAVDEDSRSSFKCDFLMTGTSHIEADEEKNTPEKVVVKGYVFDFRKSFLPVTFSATSPEAMEYFENVLQPSLKEPVFNTVWGKMISETIEKTVTEHSAFGKDSVKIVKTSHKDYVLTGAHEDHFEIDDDENIMTKEDIKKGLSDREVYLATLYKNQEEYMSSSQKGSNSSTLTEKPISNDAFNF